MGFVFVFGHSMYTPKLPPHISPTLSVVRWSWLLYASAMALMGSMATAFSLKMELDPVNTRTNLKLLSCHKTTVWSVSVSYNFVCKTGQASGLFVGLNSAS